MQVPNLSVAAGPSAVHLECVSEHISANRESGHAKALRFSPAGACPAAEGARWLYGPVLPTPPGQNKSGLRDALASHTASV